MNTQDPKYQQKSKAIYSAEPNYLSQFEMIYPVSGLFNFYLHMITGPFIEKGVHLDLNLVFRFRLNWLNRAFEISCCT